MKNLLRIKVNSIPILKFGKSKNGQDFYSYFPSISQAEHAAEIHFSFHSRTGRTTFKTTSIKRNQIEVLPELLTLVKNHPFYQTAVTPKDLDLYKGKHINFDEEPTFHPWFQVALNMKNSDVTKYFGLSKTSDADFQNLFDVNIDQSRNQQVTINCFIGKNVKVIPSKKDKDYDLSFALSEANFQGDKYTFIFCLSYDFPDIKKS
jgi:hypothetical protein